MWYRLILISLLLVACGGDGPDGGAQGPAADSTPPVITLVGENPQFVEAATAYSELGATASDNNDGDLTASIVIDASAVRVSVPGDYPVSYSVSDAAGNTAVETRTVTVRDTTPPVITLNGSDPQTLSTGDPYVELGATATDTLDGDLTGSIVIDAADVNTMSAGDYTVIYDVADNAGNAAVTTTRKVLVEDPPLPEPPSVALQGDVKKLVFSWPASEGADYYRLLEAPGGQADFSQVGEDIPADQLTVSRDIAVHEIDWVGSRYVVEACNFIGCTGSDAVMPTSVMLDAVGYFKASNAESNDAFGTSVSLSADGTVLAVGAPLEGSAASGLNGDAGDNSAFRSGAVYLYEQIDQQWRFSDYVKPSNTSVGDDFGRSVELSASGMRLAVGAPCESSSAAGIDGDQADDSLSCSGAVYVYDRIDGQWQQSAYLKSSTPVWNAYFGHSLAFDDDADTLAIGAIGETPLRLGPVEEYDSCYAGGVYVFRWSSEAWFEETRIAGSNTQGFSCDGSGAGDNFGHSVAFSGDGNLLAVGAPGESSASTGINGNQNNRDNPFAPVGAAYIFRHFSGSWIQTVYVKPSVLGNLFGYSLAVDHAGSRLFVTDPGSRAVYVFDEVADDWAETAKLIAWNQPSTADDTGGLFFGSSVAASADGSLIAVGAKFEDGTGPGIDPDTSADGGIGFNAGAAFLFRYADESWNGDTYIKSIDPGDEDQFGFSIDLDETATTIAAGAPGEDGGGSFGSAKPDDNSQPRSGAVFLY